jgi:transcription antitermination factor NusG
MAEDTKSSEPGITFQPGELVIITGWAFLNLKGIVEQVDPQKHTLRISVQRRGKAMSLELDFSQVRKA